MKRNILILDSDIPELRKLRSLFTREGYDIMTATDLETAREIMRNIPVNLVLAAPSLIANTH